MPRPRSQSVSMDVTPITTAFLGAFAALIYVVLKRTKATNIAMDGLLK